MEDCEAEAEPNMRFSHALFVVLVLHVIAVAGVFAFNSIKARQAAEAAAAKAPAAKASAKAAPSTAPQAQPSRTTAAAPAPSPAPPRTYTVVAGDTLSKIAAKHQTTVAALEAANGINASSILRIGQVLKIPEKGAKLPSPSASPAAPKPTLATVVASPRAPAPAAAPQSPARPAASSPAPPPPQAASAPAAKASPAPASASPTAAPEWPKDGIYVVAKGDNPYAIAKRFGVSYKKLLELNGIEDPTKVQIGQKLRLPPSP